MAGVFFAVIQTATIAAVGVAFARFSAYLIPWMGESIIALDLGFFKISAAQLTAIILILFLTRI
jgi:APA family basic amino acid/polyamine antiporter